MFLSSLSYREDIFFSRADRKLNSFIHFSARRGFFVRLRWTRLDFFAFCSSISLTLTCVVVFWSEQRVRMSFLHALNRDCFFHSISNKPYLLFLLHYLLIQTLSISNVHAMALHVFPVKIILIAFSLIQLAIITNLKF